MPNPPLPAANEKWSLFLDFDGTLADIAPSPDAVTLDPRVVPALRKLSHLTGGKLAVVSGRPIAELDAFLAPLKLPAAGLHGLERRATDGTLSSARTDPGALQHLRSSLEPVLAADPNLLAEDKGLSIALHYRGAPAREQELCALMTKLLRSIPGYRLVRGKCVLEAVPQGCDKGTAIEAFMNEAPFQLGRPVFVGDDVTDEDGFAAVARMKGIAIKVGPGPTVASFRIRDVDAIIGWLESLITELADARITSGSNPEIKTRIKPPIKQGSTMSSLELGVIGNCSYGALVDAVGKIVWCCLPRFDADPVFCSLLDDRENGEGLFEIYLDRMVRNEQFYLPNTAILVTRLYDESGSGVEICDFAPRFELRGRRFRPMSLVRRVKPIGGTPRIQIRLRPRFDYGATAPGITHGSNHIRYVGSDLTLRLTTNAPVSYVLNETAFLLEEPISFIFGPDETLTNGVEEIARDFQERTAQHWRLWVRALALPLEWQDAVIRAAITLKLCEFEETGAIVAAMTTSIPEAAGTERNWDYRFCWLRDAFFVVRALNSLAEVETMESHLRYLHNIIAAEGDAATSGHIQPVYGIGLERKLKERIVTSLPGYRGMGPVRVGNQAHEHIQHDVYGNAILAGAQAFFDRRLLSQPDAADFERFERVGMRAFEVHNQPDAGMWELRTRSRVHTSSSLMCWAACDRLAKIASHRGLDARAQQWQARADTVRQTIVDEAWNEEIGAFGESFGGSGLDASLLLMAEVGFLDPRDPRFVATLERIESALRRGNHLFRYVAADDFGVPENAFNICTFWYIDALARTGREDEARDIFEAMLAGRNRLGLFSEDTEPVTGEHWGNYPQTYSLVGVINCAMRLSKSWQSEL